MSAEPNRETPDDWPKHPDGTPMMIKEMEPEDRTRIMRAAADRYRAKGGQANTVLADIVDRLYPTEQSQ